MKKRPSLRQLAFRWIIVTSVALASAIVVIKLGYEAKYYIQHRLSEVLPSSTATKPPNSKPSSRFYKDVEKCRDIDLAISMAIEKVNQTSSETEFIIRTTFSYVGKGGCLRDMGSASNELWVLDSNGKKIWSTDTCPAHDKKNLVELDFGDVYQMVITWPATFDPFECGKRGQTVPAGKYRIAARNGGSVSSPTAVDVD